MIACTHEAPVRDYTLARTALQAAKEAEASRYAPVLWNSAESNYRKAELAYKANEFEIAKDYFRDSKQFSERAENAARSQKLKTEDDAP